MSTSPVSWFPSTPFGLKICIATAGMVAFGVFLLTTISHSFRASLYAGLGTGVIFFAFFTLVWVLARYAKENDW